MLCMTVVMALAARRKTCFPADGCVYRHKGGAIRRRRGFLYLFFMEQYVYIYNLYLYIYNKV